MSKDFAMLIVRLIVEFYRRFQFQMPERLRLRLKRTIDQPLEAWNQIGVLSARLNNTPYEVRLDLKHWHQRWTYIKGSYPEPHITQALLDHLGEGQLFIDIGANIGIHTLTAANQVGNTGQCVAFEPNPHSFKHLQNHLRINDLNHVRAYQYALGNESGTIMLHGCGDEQVGSSLRAAADDSDTCEVPIYPADVLLTDIEPQQAGVCKIDVEGFEYQVMLGMSGFISTHPNMVYLVEVTPRWLESAGSSAQMLFDFFAERGFDAYLVTPGDPTPRALDAPLSDNQYDVLFQHRMKQ